MSKVDQELLLAIHDLLEKEDWGTALDLITSALEQDPDSPEACNFMGYAMLNLGNDEFAYNWFRRALEIEPDNHAVLVNVGKALHEMGQLERALSYFMEGARRNPEYAQAYSNAAASLVQMSQWDDATKAAELALDANPNDKNALMNLAHCRLAKGEFGLGWDAFELALGGKQRREWSYGTELRASSCTPNRKAKTLIMYGEQGLGDEIFFADCVPDAINDWQHVTIDCDPKLEGLFKRSFPKATVHGTRREEQPHWLGKEHFGCRMALGSAPSFYRREAKDFPRKPYLVADPERVAMWRGLFATYNKPVIGLCFSGGLKKTNAAGRNVTVEDFKPLMEAVDAVYVSLEYKGQDPQGVKSFPWATRSSDYDDTAALIAACNAVVGVCTTAMHCADALGIPSYTLVPEWHNWRFTKHWPRLDNQKYIYQDGTWAETIEKFAKSGELQPVLLA